MYVQGLKSHCVGLLLRKENGKCDAAKHGAEFPNIGNHSPKQYVNQRWLQHDATYEKNLSDYKDTVPHLFHHNAIIVLANGVEAKLGSYSSQYKHFLEWKRLEETEPGVVDMETLLKGICDKHNFMDMFENFILFDDSTGKVLKILARNLQFLGVNRAIKAVLERKVRKGKLGIFWHTQGAGKSYSIPRLD